MPEAPACQACVVLWSWCVTAVQQHAVRCVMGSSGHQGVLCGTSAAIIPVSHLCHTESSAMGLAVPVWPLAMGADAW